MTTTSLLFPELAGAVLDPGRQYRYQLWRTWDPDRPVLCWIMLNPSTAVEVQDDPTVRRCVQWGRNLGFGGIVVVNLFAWRTSYPAELARVPDPVGSGNDAAILTAARTAGMVLCAWGNNGSLRGRSREVRVLLADAEIACHALRVGKTGEPAHPLYLGYDLQPQVFVLEAKLERVRG